MSADGMIVARKAGAIQLLSVTAVPQLSAVMLPINIGWWCSLEQYNPASLSKEPVIQGVPGLE